MREKMLDIQHDETSGSSKNLLLVNEDDLAEEKLKIAFSAEDRCRRYN